MDAHGTSAQPLSERPSRRALQQRAWAAGILLVLGLGLIVGGVSWRDHEPSKCEQVTPTVRECGPATSEIHPGGFALAMLGGAFLLAAVVVSIVMWMTILRVFWANLDP